jgi:hypothetical protein
MYDAENRGDALPADWTCCAPSSAWSLWSATAEAGLGASRLEQFDRVSGRVLEHDLLATHANDDVVPKVGSRLSERIDRGL